ncbi:MAG: T9SS type A sorting domain-containing protein [Bacteroidetes bacterium]|nr:T9SS type A sorting domain-containing protein [Bacteroidota bacterium]
MKTTFLLSSFIFFYIGSFAQNPLLLQQATNGGTVAVNQVIGTVTGPTFYNTVDYSNRFSSDWGLWVTDGTVAGTKKLSLTDGLHFTTTEATMLTPFGSDKILFAGDNYYGYGEVWVTDGTQEGTIGLQNVFLPGSSDAPIQAIGAIGNLAVYAAVSNDGVLRLHATNATAYADTPVIYNFPSNISSVAYFKTINNILYFEANNSSTSHNEIWRTDGTSAGTYLLKDLGADYGFASDFIAFNNKIYFITISSTYGDFIWQSDGTASGTNKLKQISTSFNQDNLFPSYAVTSTALFFTANDGVNGKETWTTDGTASGTKMLQDLFAGSGGSNPSSFVVLNDVLYLSANNGITGQELYKYDAGNGNGIELVKDIFPGGTGSNPSSLAINNNSVVFSAASNTNDGTELWMSGGDANNTLEIDNITKPLTVSSSPHLITSGNKNFFVANYDIDNDGLTKEQCVFAYTPPTKIWTGNVSSDGAVADNWFPSGAPSQSSTDNIIIPPATANNLTGPYLFIKDFYNNGGTIDVSTGLCFISGNFYNEGTINNPPVNNYYSGVFGLVSNTITTHLVGSPGTFNGQLTLSSNSNVRLTADSYFWALRIEGADTIYLGDYTLKVDTFNLYPAKIISDGSGGITRWVGSSPVMFNVGTNDTSFTPVTITNNGTQDYFTVHVKNGVFSQGSSGDSATQEVVNKTWDIEEQTLGGSDATITFQWNAADELTGFNRNNVYPAHYTNGAWDYDNASVASGNNPYTITRSGVTSFSPFAVVSSATILPVRFVSMQASLANNDAVITWTVANENNVSFYNIQRSTDGREFTTIGSKTKLINSADLHSYNYTDINVTNSFSVKKVFYRLQEVDADGRQENSQVVSVNLSQKQTPLSIWPIPSKDVLHLSLRDYNDEGRIVIFNIAGRQMLQQSFHSGNKIDINISSLPTGSYFIKAFLKNETIPGRFVKE